METLILASEKKWRPVVRNVLRAFALDCDLILIFEFQKGLSSILKNNLRIEQISKDGKQYFLEDLLEELNDNISQSKLLDGNFIERIFLFFNDAGIGNGRERLYKIVNFVIEKISSYKFDEKPSDTELAEFYEKWIQYYKNLNEFEIVGGAAVNKTNMSEAGEYRKAFEKIRSKGLAASIQNAILSLLDSIPDDVEKMIDIGAGSGYVDEAIPEDIQVLAMDIDEKILETNPRQCCIGDVLHIPLKDNSVDMAIICDVLEHIETNELEKACSEIKRISKKYVYVQVPYNENLLAGQAYCAKCGFEWHVNYHKNCFDEEKVIGLLGKEWIPVRVNYTGECRYDYDFREEFVFLSSCGINSNSITNWTCPICGQVSTARNSKLVDWLRNIRKENAGAFPRYSEIGVLFVKKEYFSEYSFPDSDVEDIIPMKKNMVDFSNVYEINKVVNVHELRPTVFSNDKCSKTEKGLCVRKSEEVTWGILGIAFPFWFMEGDYIVMKGNSKKDCYFSISSITMDGKEIGIKQCVVEKGDYTIELPCPIFLFGNKALIKIYFSALEIEVYSVEIVRKYEETYSRVNFTKEASFFKLKKQNRLYSYVVKNKNYLDFSENVSTEAYATEVKEKYLKVFSEVLEKKESLIGRLQEELAMMEFSEWEKEKAVYDMKKKEEEEEQISKALLFAMYEEIPENYGDGFHVWTLKCFNRLVEWVYSTPFLYKIVVKCGIKSLYVKIMNWRKGKV